MGGISLFMFFVLHGASNEPGAFLPNMPPIMVSGYPMANHTNPSTMMVVKGSA